MHDPKSDGELPEFPDLPSLLPPAPTRSTAKERGPSAIEGIDDVLSGSSALVLDGQIPSAPRSQTAPAFDPSVLDDGDDGSLEMLDLAASPRSPAPLAAPVPSVRTPADAPLAAVEPPAVDPIDVLALADFGPNPRGWVDAPFYAVRVHLRRRELRRELERQRGLLIEAQRGQEHVLANVVEALKSANSDASRALAERLAAVDRHAAEQGAALATASEGYSNSVAQVDVRIGEAEAQRLARESAVSEAQAEVERHRANHARGEAWVKRNEIELRAAHEAARTAAGPDAKFAPPEYGVRIRDLETEREVRVSELRVLQQAVDDASGTLRARENELRETRRHVAKLREERRALEKTASRQLDLRSAGAGQAERERLAAYAEVGRELLSTPGAVPLAESNAATDAQRIVDERILAIEKHTRALTAYDAEGARRGNVVLVVALALVIALFAMVAFRLVK